MSVLTGLELGLLIMVLGAFGITMFAFYLAGREPPRRASNPSLALTAEDARQLIALIDDLQPMKEKLRALVADPADNGGYEVQR